MPAELPDAFVPIKNENGGVTGFMDRTTADYLASKAPDPTQQSIEALLKRITRIRVVPVENYRRGETNPKTLLDTADVASLASFRDSFVIIEDPKTFGHCMCLGDPHFKLYVGEQLVAIIGYHHGASIRWEAWKHDAWLKEPDRLIDWLSARGVDGPRREVEEMRSRGEESHRQAEQWLAAMPDCFRPFWERMGNFSNRELNDLLLEALRTTIPTPEGQVLALFGWFGSGAGPWSGFPAYEAVPEQLLLHYPTQFLVDVLTALIPTETQWRGAARYFGGWAFGRTKEQDKALLSLDLKRSLLQSARTTGIADVVERAERAFNG